MLKLIWNLLLREWRKITFNLKKKQTNSVALVGERTIPTERPSIVGEVSANFFWRIEGVAWPAQRITTGVFSDF
jgi:hypothetical protein